MPFDNSPSQLITTYAAYVCSDRGAALAQSIIAPASVHGGGLSGAARIADNLPDTQVILAEIGNISTEMAVECVVELCSLGTEVIVLGEHTDIDTYRTLRNAGALEYFTLSATPDQILSVHRRTTSMPQVEATIKAPKPVIAVLGCTGGVGSSLLAQNLAHLVSCEKGAQMRTALLDADLQFGSQAIDLDRDQTPGLFEALKAPDRVDSTFVSATMDQLNEHLSLYSHQTHIGQEASGLEIGLPRLIQSLKAEFDAVIIDLPRTAVLQNPDMLAALSAAILVIPAGFSGVNAASRLIERIKGDHPDLLILPVLSELRTDAKLSGRDIVATIGLPLACVLPSCGPALARAHRAARPLVLSQPRNAYAAAVRTLWTSANATDLATRKPKRKSLLGRIFK